jgi:hypothetical protein
MAARPIPGEEQQAAEKWAYFGGPRIEVYEASGHIQTIYRAVGDDILKRRITRFPDETRPLPGEADDEFLLRRGREQLGDALALVAMDRESAAGLVRERSLGEPISIDEAQRLLAWVDGTITE